MFKTLSIIAVVLSAVCLLVSVRKWVRRFQESMREMNICETMDGYSIDRIAIPEIVRIQQLNPRTRWLNVLRIMEQKSDRESEYEYRDLGVSG